MRRPTAAWMSPEGEITVLWRAKSGRHGLWLRFESSGEIIAYSMRWSSRLDSNWFYNDYTMLTEKQTQLDDMERMIEIYA